MKRTPPFAFFVSATFATFALKKPLNAKTAQSVDAKDAKFTQVEQRRML